jgi:alpha-D-ribose 1-methylphosphonate 5-triphosphate synthase subunit PhnG
MTAPPQAFEHPAPARKHWMAVLARASAAEIGACLTDAPELPAHTVLRGPEIGLVMTRGRAGGAGAAFNLGEMTVTRCTVRAGERLGHAYVAGRDAARAELAARVDAALLDPALHDEIFRRVIEPLARRQDTARQDAARRAAATRVQFFAMSTMRT